MRQKGEIAAVYLTIIVSLWLLVIILPPEPFFLPSLLICFLPDEVMRVQRRMCVSALLWFL